jgi:hypothetical protein
MALTHFQSYVVNDVGDTIAGASITVRHEEDQINSLLYSDATAVTSIANPITSSADGYFNFYTMPGKYRITAAFSGGQSDYRNVSLNHTFPPVIDQSSTAYTLGVVDVGNYLRLTNAGSAAITLPASLGHGNEEIHMRATSGSGIYTITEATSVTINIPTSGTLVVLPRGTVTLKRISNNVWDLFGGVVGA